MSEQARHEVWESIPVGDDLGSLDYVMTAEMIADYRRVVDNPLAAYPTIAARHPARLFYRKYKEVMRVPNSGHDLNISIRPSPESALRYPGASSINISAAKNLISSSKRLRPMRMDA